MNTYKIVRTDSFFDGEERSSITIEANTFLITNNGAVVFYNGPDDDPKLDVYFAINANEWETIELIEE